MESFALKGSLELTGRESGEPGNGSSWMPSTLSFLLRITGTVAAVDIIFLIKLKPVRK